MTHHATMKPLPGSTISPGPWVSTDDCTILAADEHVVCVLGHPEDGVDDQDITNGAAILAVPEMVAALRAIHRRARPGDGSRTFDDCSRDLMLIDDLARAALAKVGGSAPAAKPPPPSPWTPELEATLACNEESEGG